MPTRKSMLLSIILVVVAIALVLFMLIEPFLSLPPIWEQLSVGVVLTVFGAICLFGLPLIQDLMSHYRATRKTRSRGR